MKRKREETRTRSRAGGFRAPVPPHRALPRRHPSSLSALEAWSLAYRLEAGGPLDFSAFPFQRELYEAFGDPELATVDVMKSAQCGISAAGISLALYAGDVWGANVVYVFPSAEDAHDFSDSRIKPAIEGSPYLRSRVHSTDNKGLKRVGDAFLYFRGSISERKALAIPADLLILDEYDRLDQTNIPKFRKRLNSPRSMKLERRFSNPSYPEDGIHAHWLASDQRRWLTRCPACGTEAPIDWEPGEGHFVDEERAERVCGRCRRALSPGSIAQGRWVRSRAGVGKCAYHISRLIVPAERVDLLVANHRATDELSIQTHHNFDLGLPYAPRGGSLSRDLVLACRRDYHCPDHYAGQQWVTMGVDVGAALHVRISRHTQAGHAIPLYIGELSSFEELGLLMDRYSVHLAVVDERPEERKAREFMEAYRGRVMLIRWSGDEQRDQVVIDSDRGLVIARRTGACDRLVAQIQGQKRLLPRDLPAGYESQVTAPHRVTETNARGQKIARYVSERADHFFFCELHDLLAKETRGPALAEGSGPPPVSLRERTRRRLWGMSL